MQVWIYLAVQIIRRLVASEVWQTLEELVGAANAFQHYAGSEKRQWVLKQIERLPPELRQLFAASAGWLVNLALEALVARLKVARG